MSQADVYRMIGRRVAAACIKTKIGCHTFRATGITAYLKNGGRLEVAQQIAAHESSRTTGLYDRRGDDVSLDEVRAGQDLKLVRIMRRTSHFFRGSSAIGWRRSLAGCNSLAVGSSSYARTSPPDVFTTFLE
jgi:integrase